ncbi:MAG: 5-(carboxyamino)imidazole ribonucleotide mutase [Acidobacteriota bacterium]
MMTASGRPRVAIVMGSESDLATMMETAKILKQFGVLHEIHVASAHRTPERAAELAREAAGRGLEIFIAGAGMAHHLAGALAANTVLPIIAVPLAASPLNGFDALLSSVQMPPGVPVAVVAIGTAGARNAAYLALQILGLSDPSVRNKLLEHRSEMAHRVEKANRNAQQQLRKLDS